MNYGLVEGSLEQVDFSLPPDTALTTQTLHVPKLVNDIQIKVGAPRWGCKHWIGKLYPPKTKDKDFVGYYATRFKTVELGSTFYALPGETQIQKWAEQVKDVKDFQFCPKFPQAITHIRRFANVTEITDEFYKQIDGFGVHCGALLLQLPDNFKPNSLPVLENYLKSLRKTHKVFVELRNKEWFSDGEQRTKAFNMLSVLNIGAVISDTAGRRDAVHMELPINEVMIRFVGNDLVQSDYKRIDDWVERIKDWSSKGLQKVWFFVHTNDELYTPELAAYLIKKLNEVIGTSLNPPILSPSSGLLF